MKKFVFLTLFAIISAAHAANLTERPAAGYESFEQANKVYREAFSRAFEFVQKNQIMGEVAEFGTLYGFTARVISSIMREKGYPTHLHLFDSFEGLPNIQSEVDKNCYEVKTYKVWAGGAMAVDKTTPTIIKNELSTIINPNLLHIHVGFFEETLSPSLFSKKLAIVHIDCDLYQSAKYVLSTLIQNDLIEDGAIVLFDDFNCSRANPNFGERKALSEIET